MMSIPFNVVHSQLMPQNGWGNSGGQPFLDFQTESINPAYWQEVDRRIESLGKSRDLYASLIERARRLKPSDCTDPQRCQTISMGPAARQPAGPLSRSERWHRGAGRAEPASPAR